ncbi:hypothetical protein HHK36_019068 [Tetracentron sinense]|uniref:DCD domain-containing protein n=1 Tax=Tetracentron sinense TaxID=13715 RepID=A0A834YVJ7_TETSI|nr:hypothetical protein HHK36_019068 [Tetracentron sinense]
MVEAKGKGKASISNSKPIEKDAGNNAKTETAASESVKMDAEPLVVISGGEEKKEGNQKEEMKNEIKIAPNKRTNKLRKRNRKNKTAIGDADPVAANDGDKPRPSSDRKRALKAESMGMIFMCSSKTKKDCYRYKVFGLPASKKETVLKIYKGMRLFLFDIDLKLMYGIYKAAAPGGYNIEPNAFKSAFPSQVRFTVLEDCLPLAEEKFKAVIKDNYFGKNKFDCQLNPEQVKNLCKLFRATAKGPKSKLVGRSSRTESRTFTDRDRIMRRGRDEVRPRALARDSLFHEGSGMYGRESFASHGRDEVRHPALARDSLFREGSGMYGREAFSSHVRDEVRHLALDRDSLFREGSGMYGREAFASPVPLPQLPPRVEPPLPPSYAYRRPLDMEYYRRDAPLEHRDPRIDMEYYRRDVPLEHRDPRILDLELRRRDEVDHRDPYRVYREPPPYRDPLYPVGPPAVLDPPPIDRLYRY